MVNKQVTHARVYCSNTNIYHFWRITGQKTVVNIGVQCRRLWVHHIKEGFSEEHTACPFACSLTTAVFSFSCRVSILKEQNLQFIKPLWEMYLLIQGAVFLSKITEHSLHHRWSPTIDTHAYSSGSHSLTDIITHEDTDPQIIQGLASLPRTIWQVDCLDFRNETA